ncbi:MAG: diguanylate cyclase [Actinomycetota bacterium]|nr:diguanylate cyclase [Actinomycetota bacterium]
MTAASTRVPAWLVSAGDTAAAWLLLRRSLHMPGAFDVVGQAADAGEALERVGSHQPDVLVLDLAATGAECLEVIPEIARRSPSTDIVVLSGSDADGLAADALGLCARSLTAGTTFDREAAQKLADTARELEATRRALARSKERVAEFVAMAAHDLKSPVHVIQGFSQLLATLPPDQLGDEARTLLGSISAGANNMAELLDDLVEGGQAKTQRPPATRSPGRPPSVVESGPKPLNVLLVEDSEEHTKLIAALLAQARTPGYHLHPVDSVRAALSVLGQTDVDCVLLDLSLPDASDLEALTQVRGAAPLLAVVVITSLADEGLAFAAVREGAQDFLVKGQMDSSRLSRAIRWAVQRKALETDLARDALHDPLTGLPNRTLLLDRLRLALARAQRSGGTVAVLYLDLDRFKPVNDRFGHHVGDETLVTVAQRLQSVIRPQDTVARIGGDEFVVVCEGFQHVDREIDQLRDRLAAAAAAPIEIGDERVVVTVSIGTSISQPFVDADADAMLRDADAAMFRMKRRSGT